MTPSLLDQYRYTISDIKLLNPQITRWRLSKPISLIKIAKVPDGNNDLPKLGIQGKFDKNHIVWSEQTVLYDVTAEFTINFKILTKNRTTDELESIGEYTNTMSNLLDIQKSFGICKVTLSKKSQLIFTIKEDRFKEMLDRAKQQSGGIYFSGGESWSMFFSYFGIIKTAVDSVALLNPYTKQVWSIVSMVPNILQMHITRNSDVEELFQKLMDIYTYINEADHLPILKGTHGVKLKLLIDKTCECADFIKKYAENNATKNFMKGPSFDNEISEFKRAFDQIFKSIQNSLMLGIRIATANIEDVQLLHDMPYAEKCGLDNEKICLPGTRQKLIGEILEWIDKEDTSERVLILSGQAGTGKSAVAHTIAKTLDDRLGSFFCFSRSDKGKIDFLFSTISRNLADRDVSWRRNLVQAIEDIAIRKSFDPVTQFNEMIIKPSIGTTKRMVIIMDALDESGDQNERKTLLNLLFSRSSELPSNYRIVITSRPEHDIAQFHQHSNVCCKYMADVDSAETLNDIQQFITLKLSDVAETLDTVDKNWCLLLAQKAQRLFQWTKIACGYILEFEGFEAAQRLGTVLSKSTSSLYEMYHQILDAQPGCGSDKYVNLLKTCVGAVIVSRKPLSVSALQAFFGPISGGGKNVKVVLKSLNSLFIGTTESTAELRPIHTSLFDFFLDPEQKPGTPNRYYIDTFDQTSFTYACLRVMNEMLRFNICGLETSHVRNRDIPNFNSRVAEAIPLHLSYACCFWGYHLEYSRLTPDILEKINDLMHDKLLYFFEVLGLLGEVEHGHSGMQILRNKTKDNNSELAARAAEASQFAVEFGTMMMESTPHLYLSSLPYISNRLFISQQFLPQYPQLLSMDFGQPIALQPEIKDSISRRHPSAWPSAVTFSPQGRQIACGFNNGDLWVWDYVTGEIVAKVGSEENPSGVCTVVFSLNGELVYCCFDDGSILTWEAKTNKVLYESNEGLAPAGCYACTISPDGRYIAFKDYESLSFYEREPRFKLFEDLDYPGGMMFSPSGSLFGFQQSVPGDNRARLWDTQRQVFVTSFAPITERWELVALNDNYVVAWDFESLICEGWDSDVRTKARVLRFGPVKWDAFSLNGEYLLGSQENKRWMCNISTGEITKRFVGGSGIDNPSFAALSPDSKYIAFDTSHTMHVLAWDALAQEEEDLSKGDGIEKREEYNKPAQVWLKGQHLLLLNSPSDEVAWKYLQVFDTTRMTGLELDFQYDFGHGCLFDVSPEDNHWSIAYVDIKSRADLLCLWNVDEKEEFILDRSNGRFTALTFSATDDGLISGDSKGNIKVWHARTRELISITSRNGLWATDLAFSSTGTTFWVAYQFRRGRHTLIRVEKRECSKSQNIISGPFKHNSQIRSISVSSNDAYIFVGSYEDYKPLFSYTKFELYDVDRVALNPVRRLDHSTGATLGYFGVCQSPKLSPNQRYIAWIPEGRGKSETVKFCDLEKNMALDGFPLAFDGVVEEFVFSNDSKRIGIFGSVRRMESHVDIWDIETKGLVMQLFSSHFEFEQFWPWELRCMSLNDTLLLVCTREARIIWDLRVHEIMTCLYDDNTDNSQSAMLPGHLQTRRLIEDYRLNSENTEVLDYALAAWNKASFSFRTKKSEDGWVLGPRDELLFWVPPKMRMGLWYPSMSHMIRTKHTKLNFDKFVHGRRWTECRNQPKL